MFLQKLFRFVPRSPLRRALTYLNQGEFAAAAELLEEVMSSDQAPADDVALYACDCFREIGNRCLREHDLAGALAAYKRAAELKPRFADVQFQLGQLLEQNEQIDAAQQAYERALAINPRYFQAQLSLARLLLQQDNISDAMQHMEDAARHGPEAASAQLRHAMNEAAPQDGEVASSASRFGALFEQLLQNASKPEVRGIEIAQQALRDGNNKAAIDEIKKLLEKNPEYPDLHNLLGVAYDNEEMVDDAIEEFEVALYRNPNFLDARINLGLTLFGRGRYLEADLHLKWVAQRKPDHKLVQSVLAQIAARGEAR
jgi:tetratricopeptide (TPR) repeat protein